VLIDGLPSKPLAHAHENLGREDKLAAGSERSFGFVFAAFFSIVGAAAAWNQARGYGWWIALGFLCAAVAWFAPSVLKPLNLLWFRFGLLLHRIVSPVMLALMFFLVFTPVGWCMRLFGKRPFALAADPARKSYWIHRAPPGPESTSFDRQF
jgi:hypothetical protein